MTTAESVLWAFDGGDEMVGWGVEYVHPAEQDHLPDRTGDLDELCTSLAEADLESATEVAVRLRPLRAGRVSHLPANLHASHPERNRADPPMRAMCSSIRPPGVMTLLPDDTAA